MLFHNPVILALMFYQKEGLFTNWLYEHPNLTRVGPDPDGRWPCPGHTAEYCTGFNFGEAWEDYARDGM